MDESRAAPPATVPAESLSAEKVSVATGHADTAFAQAMPAVTPRAGRWRPAWLVPGGLAALLAFLTVNVLAGGPLVAVDRWVRRIVQAQATSAGWRWLGDGTFAPAQLVTDLGVTEVAVPVLVVCALAAARRRRSLRPLMVAGAGLAVLAATVIPGKILVGRPGPGFAALPLGGWGDFPSGHSATAGVCYALAVLLLTAGHPGRSARRAWLAVVAVGCFLVGAALVWCDYHWATDVIAGWALAALIVWAVWRAQGALWREQATPPGADRAASAERQRAEERTQK